LAFPSQGGAVAVPGLIYEAFQSIHHPTGNQSQKFSPNPGGHDKALYPPTPGVPAHPAAIAAWLFLADEERSNLWGRLSSLPGPIGQKAGWKARLPNLMDS
jgi:hypothetical protein